MKFFDSEFASWMDHYYLDFKKEKGPLDGVHKDPPDPLFELLKQKGIAHESNILSKFDADLVKIDSSLSEEDKLSQTISAMKMGKPFIYQAALSNEHFLGYADILQKANYASSLGAFSYEPIDIKMASHPKPGAILQLCTYCLLLKQIQGIYPKQFSIITVDGEEHHFRTADFIDYFIAFKEYFLNFHHTFNENNIPLPSKTAFHWDWNIFARKQLHISDDVSMTANIRMSHVQNLKTEGITTLTSLAELKSDKVKNIPSLILKRLKEQALVQVQSKGKDIPEFNVINNGDKRCGLALLPDPNEWDVFFDMEGYPLLGDGGLEYLYGNYLPKEKEYKDFWAYSKLEEAKAFEEWMEWVYERWKQHPELHIYHYGHYEPSTLKRLMGHYGVCERIIDDLLRNQVFVNLQSVVTQGLRIGTYSYSLKEIEHLYYPKRQTAVGSGADSAVKFAAWLDTNDKSVLQDIRDYNIDDCKSTYELCIFLWKIRDKHKIKYIPFQEPEKIYTEEEKQGIKYDCSRKAIELLKEVPLEKRGLPLQHTEQRFYIAELLAHLLDYHRREENPGWWEFFSRQELDDDELMEDPYTLASVKLIKKQIIDEHMFYECEFDVHQDTKLMEGSEVIVLEHNTIHECFEIQKLDFIKGQLTLKKINGHFDPEGIFTLAPAIDHIRKDSALKSLLKTANRFDPSQPYYGLPKPIYELFTRSHPQIKGLPTDENLIKGSDIVKEASELAKRLENSILCIQGPPGTGKSHTAAQMILELLKAGKTVAISSNSHKVINSLICKVDESCNHNRNLCRPLKVASESYKKDDEALFAPNNIPVMQDVKEIHLKTGVSSRKNKVISALGGAPNLVGGTAYALSKQVFENHFDYLFIDEATQVSVANFVAMAPCARNIVMLGDQMQLQQPTKGSHPGDSGLSALVLYTNGDTTVDPTKGIFLPHSYRLHPKICEFISDAFYEEWLKADPRTQNQKILSPPDGLPPAGIKFLPISHIGNRHCSEEEVELISKLYGELLSCSWTNETGTEEEIRPKDILIVAPYNMQVEKLKRALNTNDNIGSVDLFQGKEAPIVILSMCSSTGKDAPRGPSFLLNKNRMNVALSRSKCLCLVVGSVNILNFHCNSIKEMNLFNVLADLMTLHLSFLIKNTL